VGIDYAARHQGYFILIESMPGKYRKLMFWF